MGVATNELIDTGGFRVLWRIHEDPDSGEVWFIDADRNYRFWNGSAIAPFDWRECEEQQDDKARYLLSDHLIEFSRGWSTEERTLCIAEYTYRDVVRSADKLFCKIYRGNPAIKRHTFTMLCASVDEAKRVFASMARHPLTGCRVVDPFFADGRKSRDGFALVGGGVVNRKVEARGQRTRRLWLRDGVVVVDAPDRDSNDAYKTVEEAIQAFNAIETEWMQLGYAHWALELDYDLKSAQASKLGKPATKPAKPAAGKPAAKKPAAKKPAAKKPAAKK